MSRVLVLDGNKYLRMLYALELASEGYEVVLAADGDEALERLKATRPDIVVMEIGKRTPAGSGHTPQSLRKTYKMPVILNTAGGMSESEWLATGADACLVKSSDLSELKATIRELLVRSAQQHEREVLV